MYMRLALIYLVIVLSMSFCLAQQPNESFWSTEDGAVVGSLRLNFETGTAFNENPFGVSGTIPRDFIFSFDLNPNNELNIDGILANDLGIRERNIFGIYDEEDFLDRNTLIDQSIRYESGNFAIGMQYIDIPDEAIFSPNIERQLLNRYSVKKFSDIYNWQQMEYFARWGEEDADHALLSFMTGEYQDNDIGGRSIDLGYTIDNMPLRYVDAYQDNGRTTTSSNLFALNREWNNFAIEFTQSDNMSIDNSSGRITAENIDHLALTGNFSFGEIAYRDIQQERQNGSHSSFDMQHGLRSQITLGGASVQYVDEVTEHRDEKKHTLSDSNILALTWDLDNCEVFYRDSDVFTLNNNTSNHEDVVSYGLSFGSMDDVGYFASFSNRTGRVTRNNSINIVDDREYNLIYSLGQQNLDIKYLDAYYENTWTLRLSPVVAHWPTDLVYVHRDSDTLGDMQQVSLSLSQQNIGHVSVDGAYALRNLSINNIRQNFETIKINTSVGEVSAAALLRRDSHDETKIINSLNVSWDGSLNVDWTYNNRTEQGLEDWMLRLTKKFNDLATVDYAFQVDDRREFNGQTFVLGLDWGGLNLGSNLCIRNNEADSEKYEIDLALDALNIYLNYFLNPPNNRGVVQRGEVYQLSLAHEFSDTLSIKYLRSNMGFDRNGVLLPIEEESIKTSWNWLGTRAEVSYIDAIDKGRVDRSRMEYALSSDLGNWGSLNIKVIDYRHQQNVFDISLEHIGSTDAISLHCVSNPPTLDEVDIGSEYKTHNYCLEYSIVF